MGANRTKGSEEREWRAPKMMCVRGRGGWRLFFLGGGGRGGGRGE